jgi:RNase adaptor protein for sRNA GlmZ degradation
MIKLVSFGYGHPDGPPPAHVTLDVRNLFRDPHLDPALLPMSGLDAPVRASVLRQPGAFPTLWYLADLAWTLEGAVDLVVAIGCVAGRHRAPALVAELTRLLGTFTPTPPTVVVCHRDIDRAVLPTSQH